jgi:hypothetical protein
MNRTDEVLIVVTDEGNDASEIDATCQSLLDELSALPIDRLARGEHGSAPDGTRAADVATVDTIVAAISSPLVLKAALDLIREFLSRRGGGGVVVRVGDDAIELTAATPGQQAALVEDFLARRRDGG